MSIYLDWNAIKSRKSKMQIMHPFIPANSLNYKKHKQNRLLKYVLLNNASKYLEVDITYTIDDNIVSEVML